MNFRRARWSGRVLGLSLLVLSAGVLGCVEDVGLIDRTQPNKVPKAQFQGVWYNIQTVVDIPAQSGFTFIGETYTGPSLSSASKVIFDIQEKHLLVYPIVEFVEGAEKPYVVKRQIRNYWKTDQKGELVDEVMELYTGQPIASFKILSHFDVQRQYSAATGDENNVVEENTTDRKWWQRKYVRVDWSKNEIVDFGFVARSIVSQGVDYYVQEWEAGNPDRPLFDDDAIMITTKMFAQPTSYAACEAIQGTARAADSDCAGAVIKVRNAFRKVDPNSDYVGQRYHVNLEQDKFGYFLTERHAYDERFGVTNEGKFSLIQRWNIWDKSRDVTVAWDGATSGAPADGVAHRELATCLTDDDCEGVADAEKGAANHCWLDEWFEPGHCVRWEIRPVHRRGTRPIIYHLSAVWPEPLRREAYELADEYDRVYKDTVAWAQYWDQRGLLHPQACQTNADCAAHALFEHEFQDDVDCTTNADCSETTQCDPATRRCGVPVACSESAPCDLGQTCVAERCQRADGTTVIVPPLPKDRVARALTFVLYQVNQPATDEDGNAVGHTKAEALEVWGEARLDSPERQNGAVVRFLNASPGTTASLRAVPFAGGGDVVLGAPAAFNANTNTFAYTTVPLENAEEIYHLVVSVDGQDVATRTYVRLQKKRSYLVVFAGGDKVFAVDHLMTSAGVKTGVRVVHALPGMGQIDVAYNAALRGGALEFGQTTGWMTTMPNRRLQRVTAVRSGENANVTCYHYEGQGQCVGWKPAFGAPEAAEVARLRAAVPPMFLVCENVYAGDDCEFDANGNPVDPAAYSDCRYSRRDTATGAVRNPCKDRVRHPDRPKLHGDIRYSFLYWIPEDQLASPLGYGPSAGDPDTGELFYGIAHVYGGPMETYGTYARDLVWLVNGVNDDGQPFGESDVVTSRYIREYVDAVQHDHEHASLHAALSADDSEIPAAVELTTPRMEQTALPQALQHVLATSEPPMARSPYFLEPSRMRELQVLDAEIQKGLRAGAAFPVDSPGRARLERIRGTWLEDLMITDEVKWGLTGATPTAVTDRDRDKLSPAAWMTMATRDKERARMLHLAHNGCVMQADFADESMVALARKLGCDQPGEVETDDMYDPDLGNGTCLKGETLRWSVMARIFGGTLEHEVGHTVGLRHNFSASTDVMNFQDEYFAIRERELQGCVVITDQTGFRNPTAYCEPGETCAPTHACTTNANCPNLTNCRAGRCVDLYDRVWSVCTRPTKTSKTCQKDDDCGGVNACSGGLCQQRFACSGTVPCAEGQECVNELCVRDGAVVSVLLEAEQDLPVRKFMPRPAPTQREIDLNRMEYQYASLMDYGGGINFDLHGLGKYDRAALMYGYGELVEVWQDTSGFDRWMRDAAVDSYGDAARAYEYGFQKDTTYWKYSGVADSVFSNLNDMVGIEANLKRIAAPWRQVMLERAMVTKDNVRDAADLTWIEVPYKFCSDEYRGQLTQGGCYYFDLGADIMEIVYHATVKLREYYVFDAFKREMYGKNLGGNGAAYFARILDRWLTPMSDAGMFWGLYSGIFRRLDPAYLDIYSHSVYWAWTLETTARMSLQILTELIASPAPGTYVLDEDSNRWVNVDLASKPSDLKANEANIPFGVGKFPYTTFLDEGYWRYDHALWIGSFWEKMAALLTLTDSTANFLSDYVGEQLNVGVGTSTGFNTTYPAVMGNFLGGLVAGAPELTAGVLDPVTREFTTRNVLDRGAYDDDTPSVPNSIDNLTMQLYAAVYGLSYMPAGFDPAFIDSLAVTIKGSGSDFTHGGTVETVEFTDPFGHKTYVARLNHYDADVVGGVVTDRFPWDDQPRIDVSARIIADAQAAKDEWEAAKAAEDDVEAARWARVVREKVQVLDLLRTLNEIYGDIVY